MQTNPILSPANLNLNTPPAGRAADSGTPETAFNQVLTREVEQQRKNKAPEKTADKKERKADTADAAAPQPEQASQPGATAAAKDSQASEAASAEDGAKPAEDKPAAGSPADMLAFMQNLNQAGIAPDPRQTAATGAAGADGASAGAAIETALAPASRRTAAFAGLHPADGKAAVKADAADAAGAADARAGFTDTLRQETEAKAGANGLPHLSSGTEFTAKVEAGAKLQELTTAAATVANAPPLAQPTGLHALQSAAGQVAEKLTPPVGSPDWDQALGQKIVWMAAGDVQSASLTLNPPDLGPLQVVLSVTNSQANATFVAAQPEVRQALEDAMPKLRDMLGEAGIQLGQASVESGASQSQQQQGAFGERRRAGSPRGMQDAEVQPDAPLRTVTVLSGSGLGMVDTFV